MATLPVDAPVTRREWTVLAVIIAVALVARLWAIGGVSLSHYDEGVYAFTTWGLVDADRPIHPEQRNSPIALPVLASVAYRLFGVSDMGLIGVNVAFGTLTVLVLWFLTRRWFGALPAAAAASLLACNELHIAMSRSGMTDVVFSLLFLVAMPIVSRALRRPGVWPVVAAGLSTGATWNAKSHGWLAAVIAAASLVPYAWKAGWSWKDYRGMVVRGVGLTAIAVVCYLPWLRKAAEMSGGYAALSAYLSTFLSSHVLTNISRQAMNLWYFEGLLARAAVPAALTAMLAIEPRLARGRWLLIVSVAAIAGLVVGGTVSLWVLTAAAVPSLMRRRDPGAWLLLAWGAAFLVLAPMYRPYVRIVLPLALATCITAAYALAEWAERLAGDDARPAATPAWMLAAAPVALVAVLAVGLWRGDTARWRRSRDLPEAAHQIRAVVGPGAKVVVIGEAALAYYLELEGVHAFAGFELWETVVDPGEPVYVATGIYNLRAPFLRESFEVLKDRLTPIADYPFRPYDSRLLETFQAQDALAFLRGQGHDEYALHLYRYTPDPSGVLPKIRRTRPPVRPSR